MRSDSTMRRRIVLGLLILLVAAVFVGWLGFSHSGSSLKGSIKTPPGDQSKPSGPIASKQRSENSTGTPVRIATHLKGGQHKVQRLLAYGREESALGMLQVPEQEPVGPESFTVAKNGNILVADAAKHRLAVYSSQGEYLRNVALPGIALGDVMTDSQGGIYVYDQASRVLHQYDEDGVEQGELKLNPKDIDTRGYFHVVGNGIYFADAAARDVLVATVEDEAFVGADPETVRTCDGIHAESGRVYSLMLERGQAVRVSISEVEATARSIDVSLPGVVSARYVGEDERGRFYVQTERVDGGRIALEVLAFNAAGKLLSTTVLPENDYAIWTTKLVDVQRDGTIVQFLPEKSQARLNLFTN